MNGLSKQEEKTLQFRQRQLDTMFAKRHLIGGKEQSEMFRLQDAIKTRLEPPEVTDMETKCDALFQTFRSIPLYAEVTETK